MNRGVDGSSQVLNGGDFMNAFRRFDGLEMIKFEKDNWEAVMRERSKIFKEYVSGQL